MKRKLANIRWPMGGIDRRATFQDQPPYTTVDALNVCPDGTIKKRERGGRRPGLAKAFNEQIGDGEQVDLLTEVSWKRTDGYTFWEDLFEQGLAAEWSTASWVGDSPYVADDVASVNTDVEAAGVVRAAISDLDTSKAYHIEMQVVPVDGGFAGKYRLYARMNNSTPVVTTDGVEGLLTMTASDGSYAWSLIAYASGTPTTYTGSGTGVNGPGVFKMAISGTTVSLHWQGTQLTSQTVGAAAGARIGFGLEATDAGEVAACTHFLIGYYLTGSGHEDYVRQLVAVSNGELWYETALGDLAELTSGSPPALGSGEQLCAAELRQKLYIADLANDDIKVYDPAAGTLAVLSASAGTLPTGTVLAASFNDRLVVCDGAGVWYASRQGDPTDWDYGADATDLQRAVASTSSDAGQLGRPATAIAPWGDDYMIMAAKDQTWVMRGDPAAGGRLDNLSRVVGIIGRNAWCYGPNGEFVFLSQDGLYGISPGATTKPESISRETMPLEFLDIDLKTTKPSMAYDVRRRGIHIYLTRTTAASNAHWWFDWDTRTFWPVQIGNVNAQPISTYAYSGYRAREGYVLLGGQDGYIRRYDDDAETDDGSSFSSYIWLGPMPGGTPFSRVSVDRAVVTLAEGSGGCTLAGHSGQTPEAAYRSTAKTSHSLSEGRSRDLGLRLGDGAVYLKLSGSGNRKWALESLGVELRYDGENKP